MQFKVIKGNQKNFESYLNELPKGAEVTAFACSNDASYFVAILRLSDAILEKERVKKEAESKEAIARVKAVEDKKAKQLKESIAKIEKEAEIKAKKAELEKELEALK